MNTENVGDMIRKLVSDEEDVTRVTRVVADREKNGYKYEDARASLELLIVRVLKPKQRPFIITDYHVSMRGNEKQHTCEAIVRVVTGVKSYHTVADGNGPISALDGALRSALNLVYPKLLCTRLKDYSVGVVGECVGVDSKVGVRITFENGARHWSTVGVSENLIEASLFALADALEYSLLEEPFLG